MVRGVIRDFMLHGIDDHDAFQKIRDYLPQFFNSIGDTYVIESEVREKERYYRKGKINRASNMDMIPSVIRDHLSHDFIKVVSHVTEETIYYEKENKIQWSLYSNTNNSFFFSGSTRFIDMDDDNSFCKVVMIINMEIPDISRYIPNPRMQKMVVPMIESRIPDVLVNNLANIYQQLCNSSFS